MEGLRGTRWSHTSLAVRDLDRAIAFYRAAFGFDVVFEAREMEELVAGMTGIGGQRCDLAQLRRGDGRHVLELVAFREPAADLAAPPAGHVAFEVDDVEPALARVFELGAERVGEVVRFPEGRAVYCREPGGSVFELSESSP